MGLARPVDADEKSNIGTHDATSRTCSGHRDADQSLYWRSRRNSPLDLHRGQPTGAHVPPRYSRHRGQKVAPGRPAHPASLQTRPACRAARPAGDRRVAGNGPISHGAIAAGYNYTNWRTYTASADARRPTPRGRPHSLGRARDARLGNRGCVALIRMARAEICRSAPRHAEAGRELQRRHRAAGRGERRRVRVREGARLRALRGSRRPIERPPL
jgi:hypothetical protein